MKGLILKDLYAIKGYFKLYLMIDALMILCSGIVEERIFFMLYPCILTGILALSLIAYEEREKWSVYALTLPYTRAQVVASKYLIGLIIGGANTFAILLVRLVRMLVTNTFDAVEPISLFMLLTTACLMPAAIMLPFLFKFGAEKGRLIYYLSVGAVCGLLGAFGGMNVSVPTSLANLILPIVCVISLLCYIGSCFLSIKVYQKKEL